MLANTSKTPISARQENNSIGILNETVKSKCCPSCVIIFLYLDGFSVFIPRRSLQL